MDAILLYPVQNWLCPSFLPWTRPLRQVYIDAEVDFVHKGIRDALKAETAKLAKYRTIVTNITRDAAGSSEEKGRLNHVPRLPCCGKYL